MKNTLNIKDHVALTLFMWSEKNFIEYRNGYWYLRNKEYSHQEFEIERKDAYLIINVLDLRSANNITFESSNSIGAKLKSLINKKIYRTSYSRKKKFNIYLLENKMENLKDCLLPESIRKSFIPTYNKKFVSEIRKKITTKFNWSK